MHSQYAKSSAADKFKLHTGGSHCCDVRALKPKCEDELVKGNYYTGNSSQKMNIFSNITSKY